MAGRCLGQTHTEGWQNDDYFIVFTEDESLAAMKAYRFDHHLPGYTLLGIRGWDDFIVINSSGVMFTIPKLPLDSSYAAPFALPQEISLEPDERFAGRIKWYTKPLVFGGDAADKINFAWITHEQHAELVTWWNEQYRSTKTQI